MTKEKKPRQLHYREAVVLPYKLNPDMEIIKRNLLQTLDKHFEEKKPRQLPIREPVVLPFEPDIPIEIINSAVDKALKEYLTEENTQIPVDPNCTKNPQNGD